MREEIRDLGFKAIYLTTLMLILSVLSLSSCRKELENLNKEAWTPGIGIPLFYSKVTGSDIAYDWLKANSVLIDSSQIITVVYESKGKTINLLDTAFFLPQYNNSVYFSSINIGQTNSSTFISLGKFSDDFTIAVRDSIWNNHGSSTILPSLYNERSVDNKLNGFSQIEGARVINIVSGYLTVSVSNATPYTLSGRIVLVDATGSQINDSNIVFSSLASGTSFTYQTYIANKRIAFPIKANFLELYAPEVMSMVDTALQGISITLTFSPLTLNNIEGQFNDLMLEQRSLQIASHPIFLMNVLDGELVIRTKCTSCSNVDFNFTFPTVKMNGQPLIVSATANSTTKINISNSIWQLPSPSELFVNATVSSNSPDATFSTNDSIIITLSIENYDFKMAKFLPKKSEASLMDTISIPFFARTQGNVTFLEPYMEIQIINGLLCEVTASISNIFNSMGDYLISPYIGSFVVLDPAPMENSTVQSFQFDTENSNIKSFVNNQPANAYVEHIVLLNDTIKLSRNNNSTAFKSSLALPFRGSVSGLIVSDTTILQADVLENTKDATLYITATNYFSLQTKVFILTATLPLDTIATVVIPPNTTQENRLITEVYLNESAIHRLKSDKRVIITAIFDSPSNTPTITIKSSQYFEIHAGVNSRTVIGY